MPISSYPRITLNNTNKDINPQNGTGIVIYDFGIDAYRVLDSNSIPVNEGGFAANNTLISTLGPKLPDLLVSNIDDTIAGNNLYFIRDYLQQILDILQNGTGAIQIKGANGNLANVTSGNRLNVAT